MISGKAGAIVLSGPPGSISGVLSLGVSQSTVVPLSVSVHGESTVYRAVLRPSSQAGSEIRLQLPPSTPPGAYTAEAILGGKARRLLVEVESVMRLRVQPKQSNLTAAAASSAPFELTVTNSGNVPFDVPETDVFDLDDPVVQDRALGRTLRASLSKDEKRVDRLFEELREGHAGEGRVRVRTGAGTLEPGESRTLSCVLDVPATARAGRSYLGPWKLGNAAHLIRADISAKPRTTNGKAKR